MAEVGRLVELRVLEGPNLYFPRPAVKLTLDVSHLLDPPEEEARRQAASLRVEAVRVGGPGSERRARLAARLLARLTREVAAAAGVRRLAVRSRPGPQPTQAVVAFPWRRLEAARALGEAVAALTAQIGRDDLLDEVERRGRWVAGADPGPPPSVPEPAIPVVGVTGTNGKSTVTRLVAHLGRHAGLRVGWCTTDGVYFEGRLVEGGDWSGFSGAGQVLAQEGIELAVLEIARGGILLRGMGVSHLDVAVVTNVSEDHLGEYGVETLDQLAEVKSAPLRIVRPHGWGVLNADDPRVLAMRARSPGRPFVFSRHPHSPGIRASLQEGGRAATVLDGEFVALDRRGEPHPLLPVREAPATLAGLSSIHVENVLAAAAAGLGVGLPAPMVGESLRSFRHQPDQNPGRLNLWELNLRTVVVDYAHNEASLQGLLEVVRGLCPPGSLTWVIVGTAGDRPDRLIRRLGEVAAMGADRVAIGEKERYLRGRDRQEMVALIQEGAGRFGKQAPAYPTELDSLQGVVAQAGPGDVVGLCCHAELLEVNAWLEEEGGRLLAHEELLERIPPT